MQLNVAKLDAEFNKSIEAFFFWQSWILTSIKALMQFHMAKLDAEFNISINAIYCAKDGC